ncbi:hypothetical protein PMIT1313_01641 [Prochlorococcus marinus str. MIT 1313]|nr:hypothetical protein PMIT1313_01641 [Prochlorococcus marinus str. MIT 1313]KZR71801.1 hypothetical protein PMIT1318_01609 [Prochlorococcus marinus str. MIT 1318]
MIRRAIALFDRIASLRLFKKIFISELIERYVFEELSPIGDS